MQKELQIKTDDGHNIDGVLDSKIKEDKLIIFVHGLTGHKNEHHFFNGAKYFTEEGFDTFRFNLYSGGRNCRRLRSCTLRAHSNDLEVVLEYFKDKYEEIFLVGHSLGGPTILQSNHKCAKAVVLWDPSYRIMDSLGDDLKFNKELDLYLIDWGVEYLVSKKMIEEWKVMPDTLINGFTKPTKIICAGKEIVKGMWEKNISKIKVRNEFMIIDNAGHVFNEEAVEEKLFEETLMWFKGD